MPRGNDKEDALADLANKFGQGVGNAEQLIEANLAMHTAELRRAEILPRDEDATAELLQKLGSLKGPNGEPVIDAAVRGGQLNAGRPGERVTTIVYEDEAGRHHLGVLDEKGKPVQPDLSAAAAVAERSPAPKQKEK